MCYRMEHVTYLERENGVIVRETKGVKCVAQRATKKSLSLEKTVLARKGTEQCRTVVSCRVGLHEPLHVQYYSSYS